MKKRLLRFTNVLLLPLLFLLPVPSASICSGTNGILIHSFSLAASSNPDNLSSVKFMTTGNYASSEITSFKLYRTTSNAFSSTNLLSTISSPATAGAQTFPSFTSSFLNNTTYYYWITMDVAASVVDGHTIEVNGTLKANITAGLATITDATLNPVSGTQTLKKLTGVSHNVDALNVCQGYDPAALTATVAGGKTPFSYQWKLNNNDITGATSSSYDSGNLDTPGNYSYKVIVTDACGATATSSPKAINVSADPVSPTINPSPTTSNPVCVGSAVSATFNSGSGGTGTITDTYEYSTNGGSTWAAYVSGTPITATAGMVGANKIQIHAQRTATGSGCNNGTINIVQWTVSALPNAPTAVDYTNAYDGTAHTGSATVGTEETVDWYAEASGTTTASAPTGTNVGTYTAYAEARNTSTGCVSATRTLVTVTINKRPLTITANNRTKTYGDVLTMGTTLFSTSVNGLANSDAISDVTLTSDGSAAPASVADYSITPSAAVFATGSASNYDITYATTGKLTVGVRPITITANNQGKTYGETFTFANTEYATSDGTLAAGQSMTLALASDGSAAAATVAGYDINISNVVIKNATDQVVTSNYTITPVKGTLTVNSRPITITANNQGKTYGETFTFANTEYATSDGTLAAGQSMTLALASDGSAAAATVAGYDINISNVVIKNATDQVVTSNYTITPVKGTLTVNSRPITITANNQGKTYGETFTFANTEYATSDGTLAAGQSMTLALASDGSAAAATVAGYDINISNVVIKNATDQVVTSQLDLLHS